MAVHDEDKLWVRLHLYDTEMRVNITRKDEPMYRDAATLISETINRYAQVYTGRKSDKEIFYMAAVDIALKYEREKRRNNTAPYTDILEKLTSEIEDALGKE